MLNKNQIKAALGLLGMSNAQLAKELKLHANTINSVFKDKYQTSSDVMRKIDQYVSHHGIYFIGNRMVSDLLTSDLPQPHSEIEATLIRLTELIRIENHATHSTNKPTNRYFR